MSEEKIDDIIIAIAIFFKALFILVVILPLQKLAYYAKSYPYHVLFLVMGSVAALLADKVFTGTVQSPVIGIAFLVAVIGSASILAMMWPLPKHHEFEHGDHKTVPDRNDWFTERDLA